LWTDKNRAKYSRDHLRYPSDLTDDEWAHVGPLIPPARRGGGKRRSTNNVVFEFASVHPSSASFERPALLGANALYRGAHRHCVPVSRPAPGGTRCQRSRPNVGSLVTLRPGVLQGDREASSDALFRAHRRRAHRR
jgi:transposase